MSRTISLQIDYDYDFDLIGIHTAEEDYRLCYYLNKFLNISLYRCKEDVCLKMQRSTEERIYALYEYMDTYRNEWFLVANKTYSEMNRKKVVESGIFGLQETRQMKKSFLIKEKKNIDFFIQINGSLPQQKKQEIIRKIRSIPAVVTAYEIDVNTLKSRENLIFTNDCD